MSFEDSKSLSSSPATLSPLFVYGVKPDVKGGIYFGSDNVSVIYAAGCGIAQYNSKVKLKHAVW
jgi:hypothetical protein